jgi:ATP-binding cassette subfamily F protein 3
MSRIATSVIEVRDGHVTNYGGDYEAYLYAVNREIDEGERARHASSGGAQGKPMKTADRPVIRDERKVRKELSKNEKLIARLDKEKNEFNAQLLKETDPHEAMRLHEEVTRLTEELTAAEERWCELQEELEAAS